MAKFRYFDKYLPEILQIIKGGPGTGKNYLALVKPKSLFLVLLSHSIQFASVWNLNNIEQHCKWRSRKLKGQVTIFQNGQKKFKILFCSTC